MEASNIIFAIICFICSLFFIVIAIWSFNRKDPMHFCSGSTIKSSEITDIKSYNRANGWMWTIYTLSLVTSGIIALFNIKISAILLLVICVPGTIILIVTYKQIFKKFKK